MSRLPSLLSPSDHDLLKRHVGIVNQLDANLVNREGGASMGHDATYWPPSVFRFKNTASETAPRGAVMRITTGASYDNGYIPIAKPDTSFQRLYLVNIGGDVPQDQFGRASFLTGEQFNLKTNVVLYDTANTPAYGESWGPQNGTWTIKKGGYGFRIIGGNTGTGATSRTIAVQIPVSTVYGKPTGSKSEGATDATIAIWDRAFAGSLGQSTGADVIIRVRDVTTATRVSVDVDGSPPVAFPIDCEDPA